MSQDFTKNWVDDHTFSELRDAGERVGSVGNRGSDQDTLSVKYLWANQVCIFFWLRHSAFGILAAQQGVDRTWAPTVKAPSLSHWTIRELPAKEGP